MRKQGLNTSTWEPHSTRGRIAKVFSTRSLALHGVERTWAQPWHRPALRAVQGLLLLLCNQDVGPEASTKRHSRGIVKTSKLLALSARRNLAKQYHTIYLTERFRFDEKPGVTYAFAWQVISEAPTFGSSIKGSCSELTYVSKKGRGSTCDAAVWTSRRLGSTWAQP